MKKQIAEQYLKVRLKDNSKVGGGISFIGETLGDFVAECNVSHETPMEEMNEILRQNGIKKIKLDK